MEVDILNNAEFNGKRGAGSVAVVGAGGGGRGGGGVCIKVNWM